MAKFYLGIDMGGSAVKLAALYEDMTMAASVSYSSDESLDTLTEAARELITSHGLDSSELIACAVTGVGSSVVGDNFLGAPVTLMSEFESFGKGGQCLSGKSKAVVVSMGTGTAFVRADGSSYTHIGGSGVGGGTMGGLCELLCGTRDNAEVDSLTSQGNTAAVDLTIGDICKGKCGSLASHVTAANFGKNHMSREKADIAAGVLNLVFQTAGVMAGLACRGTDIEAAVFVGTMTGAEGGKDILEAVNSLYPELEFIVPGNGAFAGAIGAVQLLACADTL